MPYDVKQKGSRWVVVKTDDGKIMGTHGSAKEAHKQKYAIEQNEKRKS